MATGVIRALHLPPPPPPPCYFPIMQQHSPPPPPPDHHERYPIMHQHSPPPREDQKRETPERREEGERQDEEEDDEDGDDDDDEEECDALEEDEAPHSPPCSPDVTNQLLRFADIISRDVRRYFGRCPGGDQDTCDIYNDSVSVTTTGGRLRYYDDLLRLARAGSPPVAAAGNNTGLGPLADLFDQGGRGQGRGRPMSKRHLPLSFWTEPIPCCHLLALGGTPAADAARAHGDSHAQQQHYGTHTDAASAHANSSTHCGDNTHANSSTHCGDNTHANSSTHCGDNAHANSSTHCGDNTHPDFSDLLAHWDHNPEHVHTH